MKLVSARVTNYRNIDDSNEVSLGQSTCLVGKNEAGKTAFLKALEGLKSSDSNYQQFAKTENYPRRHLADYDTRHPDGPATVIATKWAMDDADVAAVEAELGEGTVKDRNILVRKGYETKGSTWAISIDNEKVLAHLVKRFGLNKEERAALKDAKTTTAADKNLSEQKEPTEKQSQLLAQIKKYRKSDAELHAIDLLQPRIPSFLYFSHYDRMSGELSLNKLKQYKDEGKPLEIGDQVFLDFLEYAGTTLDELVAAKKFEELNAQCEAAANKITDQIFEYWTQNDELEIKVLLTEGKPEDPPPFNTGHVARARVENKLHRVTVPFSERSAGFIWFFSFLVKFAQIKKRQGNVVILLDEPGLTLHGTAQKDLLRYFREQLEPHHQLIFSTHSPFMVPADRLSSVRTVEDVIVRGERDRKKSLGTKIREDVLTTDVQTNFPIFGAMGFEVTQSLLIGKNTLLVEGPSDILYLQAASRASKTRGKESLNPRWAICPSGGIDKVIPFVRLFYGNKLNTVVLTDYERGQKRKLEDLYKAAMLEDGRIILATEISKKEEADIEDFFDPELFVELVNSAYALAGEHALTVEKLNKADASVRLVKKAEAYFRLLPEAISTYSHFEPANYLLTHPEFLDRDLPAVSATLERFQEAFVRVNKFMSD